MFNVLHFCRNKFLTKCHTKIIYRRFMKTSEQLEEMLKKHDYIPERFKLVYRHKEHRQGAIAYHLCNFSVCLSMSSLAYLWYQKKTNQLSDDAIVYLDIWDPIQYGTLIAGAIFLVWLAGTARERYAIRVYHDPLKKMYRSIFHGRVPFTKEFYEFPEQSLTVAYKETRLPWRLSLYKANGRKMYLLDENFKSPSELYKMLKPGELDS